MIGIQIDPAEIKQSLNDNESLRENGEVKKIMQRGLKVMKKRKAKGMKSCQTLMAL